MMMTISPLRPYQLESIDWLESHQRSILGSDPGTGKTRVLLERKRVDTGPTLVVCCLRSALRTWRNELGKWCPDVPFVTYHGTPKQRLNLVEMVKGIRKEGGYVLTTPAMLKELPRLWSALVVDEAHKLKNRRTQSYKLLTSYRSKEFYWVTGSPLVNTPADLWTALHMIEPARFPSYWRWVGEHCHLEKTAFGIQVYGVKNPASTRKMLEQYYFAKYRSDIQSELPPKNRYALYAEMTHQQQMLYRGFRKEMYATLSDGRHVLTLNELSRNTRLRQLLISPELLPDWEGDAKSGAIEALLPMLEEDIAYGNQVIIFCPFTEGVHAINRAIRKIPTVVSSIYHGAMSKAAAERSIDDFQSGSSNVLLSTIRSAASWDGYAASVAYFLGYDYAPAYNIQAENRLHRIGQTKSVDIRYIINEGTFDEHILEILDGKVTWDQVLFGEHGL